MTRCVLQSPFGEIELVDETGRYTFDSAKNARDYPIASVLPQQQSPSVVIGVLMAGRPLAIFGSDQSGIDEHSAVILDGTLMLAVGEHVVCLALSRAEIQWMVKVDSVACYGVHYEAARDALISHGELAITRLTRSGQVLWSASGRDIFSKTFTLRKGWIEAVDWDDRAYRFDYDTGRALGA